MKQFSKKKGGTFFPRLLKRAVLDQLTVDSGGVSRERYVAVAVGCWLFALQWHFNGTSTALPRNFHGTSTAKKNLLELLSKSVKRVSVSCMQDFFLTCSIKCGLHLGQFLVPRTPLLPVLTY